MRHKELFPRPRPSDRYRSICDLCDLVNQAGIGNRLAGGVELIAHLLSIGAEHACTSQSEGAEFFGQKQKVARIMTSVVVGA